jgi:hypothetical protein
MGDSRAVDVQHGERRVVGVEGALEQGELVRPPHEALLVGGAETLGEGLGHREADAVRDTSHPEYNERSACCPRRYGRRGES